MIKQICIIGHPSNLGGADTELLHQIVVWQKLGLKIHICHVTAIDKNIETIRQKYISQGIVYHPVKDWRSLKGLDCISFCNGTFLSELSTIKMFARSATFVNCMTWNFPKEIECQSRGLIDFHLYQTQHGLNMISPRLQGSSKPYRPLLFKPYFEKDLFPFINNRDETTFRFGRISRADKQKYNNEQFNIYDSIRSNRTKKGIILGWNRNIEMKYLPKPFSHQIKHPPKTSKFCEHYNYIKFYAPGEISQQEFYKNVDVSIVCSDTFENLPRTNLEAMSSGTVVITDNRGGNKIQVENEITGYLCNTKQEFIQRSNELANDKDKRNEMAIKAREKLEKDWGLEESMKSWQQVFDKIEKLK